MRKLLLFLLCFVSIHLYAQQDTVYVSDKYTSYFIFSSDINYADLSNQTIINAKVVEESRNKLALKAVEPFSTTASISMEETNGKFHSFIVAYKDEPQSTLIDCREGYTGRTLADLDTVYLSNLYTTHFIFSTDINFADVSRPNFIAGKLVEQGKNKLALKARAPFEGTANVTVEEMNGLLHSYILCYRESPEDLIIDTRDVSKNILPNNSMNASSSSMRRKGNAPQLSEIIKKPQTLYHLMDRKYKLEFKCENIFSYSDMTYIVLSLENRSSISYSASDAIFAVTSAKNMKKKLVNESYLQAKNKFGSLSTSARGVEYVVYSFDKITLNEEQVMNIYIYEDNGQRNLVLTLSAKDINNAISPLNL